MHTREELKKKSVADLKKMCKLYGIKGYSGKKEDEIIDMILAKEGGGPVGDDIGDIPKTKIEYDEELGTTGTKEPRGTDALEKLVKNKFLAAYTQDKSVKEISKEMAEIRTDVGFERIVDVDYWLTDLHDAEIGIFQKERFMAKNRSFSRNLELIGAVKEPEKANGIFGFDKDNWKNVGFKELAKKRLVIKWFNAESIAHLGTLEEMFIESISSSIAADDTLPAFKLIIPRYKYVVNLKKEHTKLPKIGELFTFAIKIDDDEAWEVFSIREKRVSIGSDWRIRRVRTNQIIGKIDEKIFNVGGKFK
ncbi:MAG: Rho termination factor N-terminal domain-containing protein, partial [Candidatus Hodarchaeota archaeon]